MITTFYPPYSFGGDGVAVRHLALALVKRGHEVDVIHCADSYRLLGGDTPADLPADRGVTVHRLSSRAGFLSPLATQQTGYPLFKGKKIRRILDEKQFDVIHFHNLSLIGGPMLLREGDAIKLYTVHEQWLLCPTHVLFKFRREICTEQSCFLCQLSYGRPPQLWRYTDMLRSSLNSLDALISPSIDTLHRHQTAGFNLPILHLPNFVPETVTPPISKNDAGDLPQRDFFLFVGRLEKIKGVQTLIPLFRKYEKADLVIAGEGSFAGDLRKLAAGCSHIHFVGHLNTNQLRACYARALAVLIPSIVYEVFALVALEALAAKVPLIVRDIGGLSEVVAQSGGGLVFQTDEELLSAMEQLRTQPELRNKLGQAGFEFYRRNWTENAHMEQYLGLIENIRERKVAGPK